MEFSKLEKGMKDDDGLCGDDVSDALGRISTH